MTDIDSLFERLNLAPARRLPPVEQWRPARSGVSDIRIDRDGRWFYRDSEIRRPEMVRLFATVLRRDDDGIYLVTPVEKLSVEVEDAPFVAIDMETSGEGDARALLFVTNVGDVVAADATHPIVLRKNAREARPYITVRRSLDALIARPMYYRLAALAQPGAAGRAGVWSNGEFFALE